MRLRLGSFYKVDVIELPHVQIRGIGLLSFFWDPSSAYGLKVRNIRVELYMLPC